MAWTDESQECTRMMRRVWRSEGTCMAVHGYKGSLVFINDVTADKGSRLDS